MDRFTLVACGVPVAAILSIPTVFATAFVLFSALIETQYRFGFQVVTDGDVPTIPAMGVTLVWIALLAFGLCLSPVTYFLRARFDRFDPPAMPPDRKLLP
ncbi:MAG TPA: hypothetical protein VMI54_08295 [Polyangiaceae bacterium]|nr:hypothetical protein [Polyangiaceae bacterium]